MASTLNALNEVETTISYDAVMIIAISLIKQAEVYNEAGMTKEYTLECLNDIRSALVELEWNTHAVDEFIQNQEAR
jgi:hypothetical protein